MSDVNYELIKKKAKLSPSYEAYRGIVSRFLGLHQLFVGNTGHFIVTLALLGAAGILFGIGAYEAVVNPNHARYCCYPEGAPHGSLGSCTDPDALVHDSLAKLECATHGLLFFVCVGAASLALVANYIYVHASQSSFFERAARDFDDIAAYELRRTNKDKTVSREDAILEWLSDHSISFAPLFLPETFLFGYVQLTLGKTARFVLHNLLLWAGVLFAVIFFEIALPLDDAWRCYPQSGSLTATDLGRCNVANTVASRRYHVQANVHTNLFWVALGVWAGAHTLFVSLYLYTVLDFRVAYAEHLARKMKL
jgi:TM2 domain-containing membrane protein YozV